jgi:two-component system cell cycle sensor histidine kinase/response regulator CckA
VSLLRRPGARRAGPTGPAIAEPYPIDLGIIPVGVVVHDGDGAIIWGNPAAESILGLTHDNLLGRTSIDPRWQAVHEDGTPFPGEDHPAMLALNTGRNVESVIMGVGNPAEGRTRWIQVSAAPFCRPGETRPFRVVATFFDVSDRKRAEDELRRREARLNRAETVARFGHWELDLRERTMRGSDGARLLYGLEGNLWELGQVQAIPLPEHRAALDEALRGLVEADRPYDIEFRLRRADDGELRHVHSTAQYDRGRQVVFGVVRDITERKLAEEQRRELELQVQHLHRLESLGRLAGGVAHDMNNVLTAILGFAEIEQADAPPGSPLSQHMATIGKACLRGRTLLRGLLEFAREGLAIEEVIDLNDLVREEVALLERTTLQRVRLQADLAPALRPIMGDPAALNHVLMNLCLNAVDAMPQGGDLILRTCNDDPAHVVLEVIDHGVGMAPEVLEKAMEPFFTTKAHGKGTGLGLAIACRTVAAHHGAIGIRSTPGQGTTVSIRLPACTSAARRMSECEAPSAKDARCLRVLVVDDDELIRLSTSRLLEALGHATVIAGSGESALELLQAGAEFDVVILDINMPGIGGAGTLPRLRELRPDLPVLLATGRVDQVAVDLVESTTGVTLMPKPYRLKDLKAHLAAIG